MWCAVNCVPGGLRTLLTPAPSLLQGERECQDSRLARARTLCGYRAPGRPRAHRGVRVPERESSGLYCRVPNRRSIEGGEGALRVSTKHLSPPNSPPSVRMKNGLHRQFSPPPEASGKWSTSNVTALSRIDNAQGREMKVRNQDPTPPSRASKGFDSLFKYMQRALEKFSIRQR